MSVFTFKNKNIDIAIVDYNEETNSFNKLIEWKNKEYAPYYVYKQINNKSLNPIKTITWWYNRRSIPTWRDGIDDILSKLNIKYINEIDGNMYKLSLDDQYWLKPLNSSVEWEDINYFQNDFDYLELVNSIFSNESSTTRKLFNSPNFTTDGMIKKAWIIDENKNRVLIKSGYKKSTQEPFNEVLASEICKALNIDHVVYNLNLIGKTVVCESKNFINSNEELIPAEDIYLSEKKDNNTSDYMHYINILEKNGLSVADEKMQDMIVIDYLMLNEDRHLRNFGVIRNVDTLKFTRIAPIFDTGQSLQSQSFTEDMNFNTTRGKFFSNINSDFDELIDKYVDLSRYDFNNLYDLKDKWKNLFIEFKDYTNISEERLNKLLNGFETRINKIKELQLEQINERSNCL